MSPIARSILVVVLVVLVLALVVVLVLAVVLVILVLAVILILAVLAVFRLICAVVVLIVVIHFFPHILPPARLLSGAAFPAAPCLSVTRVVWDIRGKFMRENDGKFISFTRSAKAAAKMMPSCAEIIHGIFSLPAGPAKSEAESEKRRQEEKIPHSPPAL